MLKKFDLYLRLYPSYLLILIAGVGMVAVPSSWFLVRSYENQIEEQLSVQAETIAKLMPTRLEEWDQANLKSQFEDSPFRITVIQADGSVFFDNRKPASSMENHLGRPEIQHFVKVNAAGTSPVAKRFSQTLGVDMLYYALRTSDGFFIRLAHPVNAIYATLKGYLVKIFLTAFMVAIFAAFVSFYTGQRITKPLKHLERKAEELSRFFADEETGSSEQLKGVLSKKITFSTYEFERLSSTLDKMALQLVEEINRKREQFHRHQVLLKSMVEGVLSADMDGQILNFNKAAIDMFNLPANKDLNGTNLRIQLRNPVLLDAFREVHRSGKPSIKELQIYNPSPRYLEVKSVPLLGYDGDQVGVVMVGQDLTGVRSLAKMRKDFVANVSHELRTPITAIKGFVETLLGEPPLDEEQRTQFLEIVLKHTDRMAAIIEDLLSLSNLEGKREDVKMEKMELRPVIESAIQGCQKKADKKEIEILLDEDSDCEVRGNAVLMEQAIVNLLDNAIKYSPEQTQVAVRVFNEDGMCQIEVIDQGIGIPRKYHDRLFERFFRVDKARSKSAGGTGLGLSIVKHIVALHGGQVHVSSRKGQGSTFTIGVPCCPPASKA